MNYKFLKLVFILALIQYGCESTNATSEVKSNSLALDQYQQKSSFQEGDLIFQSSKSRQSKAIQLATDSKYSHMGMIYEEEGNLFVFEAVQPVKITPLSKWIKRGENGDFVLKRLKNANEILTDSVLDKMKRFGEQFIGKPYDIHFEWTDDKIYCSELVWKIYREVTGIEIGELEKLSDFDLSSDEVKTIMNKRYGNEVPLNEKVISPVAMFESDKLVTVTTD
ncbi:YiiX family permuted papain-like enzyme [Brumimicrobium aurantiacum]|uniref:YiiX family permuted papain-like enzyme n=1 Tax=Brumimicrobium aurantiacum TaxID=1737063 RepID=A0A3E1EWI0_9FLAO|nr:YiiX family permuted papain-like enzyme [Brumimicrobium aurantiacum]RFC53909.1 YiiX family permuted papain-like enzyme [Brumimicrobium aurantiacum]